MSDEVHSGVAASPVLLANVGVVLGGAEVYVSRLSELLSGPIPLMAFCAHSGLAEQLEVRGVRVYKLPLLRWRRLNRLAKYITATFALVCLTLRHRVRLVHLNGYQTSYLIPVARLLGLKTLITPHHLPNSRMFRLWYKMTARWVDGAINVSGVMDQTHRNLLPQVRSCVIPNWVPGGSQLPVSLDIAPRRRLLFVGRLVSNKGLSTLFEAIRSLNDELELLVSGEGPLREHYEHQAKGLSVRFLGYAPELSRLYTQVDALVVPSNGPEGSCLVGLEAMASGLPCIMSDLPVFREIAENGKAALLFKAGDAQDLARSIRLMMTEREQMARMADHARQMVDTVYSEQAVKSRYLALFQEFRCDSHRALISQGAP